MLKRLQKLRLCVIIISGDIMSNFAFEYSVGEDISKSVFRLHNHDDYEIYMFIEGDSNYVVEGRSYSLQPYDMIVIRRHEMHRVYHRSNAPYSRFVIMVKPEFFDEHACRVYERQFKETHSDAGNKITADVVRSSGLYDAYMRLKKYSCEFTVTHDPVVQSIIVEILYLIDKVTLFAHDDSSNKQLADVINYINSHYTEDLYLEDIASRFFISKYHLCHLFKETTGLTMHTYINRKRITRVRELVADGSNITNAVVNAGFNNYSSFYRAYVKVFGVSPGKNK